LEEVKQLSTEFKARRFVKKGVSASRAEGIFVRNVAAFDNDSTQSNIGFSCNTFSYLSAVSVHTQETITNDGDHYQGSEVHFDVADHLEIGDEEPVDSTQDQYSRYVISPTDNSPPIIIEEIELANRSERPTAAATVTSASVPMEVPSE
jgi:hypothetical protein